MWKIGPEWGYFREVGFRPLDPFVRAWHSVCFNASIVSGSRPVGHPRPGEPARDMQLVKNIWNLPPVFVADSTQLIVNREVRDLISNYAKVNFIPASIAIAWNHPYEPGKLGNISDLIDSTGSWNVHLDSFINDHQVISPDIELYEVCMHRYCDYPDKYNDRLDYELSATMDGRDGVDCEVSPTMLMDHGLFREWGFVCTTELLQLLGPFLRPYFFWYGAFPFRMKSLPRRLDS